MTSREFFYLVCSMRAAQKSYFKNRAQDTFRACRALENDVDREIARVKAVIGKEVTGENTKANQCAH